VFAAPARAQAPPAETVTPQLIEAAKKEGTVILYSSMDLPVGEKLGKAFEAHYRDCRPDRALRLGEAVSAGSRRKPQAHPRRRRDEQLRRLHFIPWKKNAGWRRSCRKKSLNIFRLTIATPTHVRDVADLAVVDRLQHQSGEARDAPKSFADLLDPKWAGKMVKGHPAYSGTIMTATFETVRELGWDYYEKLSKQRVMQVQSSTDPPKKLSPASARVMADATNMASCC